VKFEKVDVEKSVLRLEMATLTYLQGVPHFTRIFHFGKFHGYSLLVMELLGPSLLFEFQNINISFF
jgi:hypothetical protein